MNELFVQDIKNFEYKWWKVINVTVWNNGVTFIKEVHAIDSDIFVKTLIINKVCHNGLFFDDVSSLR